MTVLADPTRRQIIAMLAERERSAGELVAAFAVSQPAISRHLRILREAGLVAVRGEGQRRIYQLDAAPLAALDDWLMGYRRFWSARLDGLERRIEERRREALTQATEEER
ncbi:MAG TPA: metalloregulator ArsR/SmtB family transcription factor [Thermomicrobiales bacterium]